MAKKASGTSLAIRDLLTNLPAETFKETSLNDLYSLVQSDKAVLAAMKKQSMTESSIKQLIQKIKKERGLVRGSKETPAPAPAKTETKKLFSEIEVAEAKPSSKTESKSSAELTIEEALQVIEKASSKNPQLIEAIKVAGQARLKLAEQQKMLSGIFGE